jgi:hypothetical protein
MPIYSERMQLAAQFATAARLYAEAVVLLTADSVKSLHDYNRLLETVQKTEQRAESAGLAFQEHIDLHRRDAKARNGSRTSRGITDGRCSTVTLEAEHCSYGNPGTAVVLR